VRWLHDQVILFFESSYEEAELVIPYDRQAVLSEMHDNGRVVDEKWEDTAVTVTWRAEPDTIARIKSKLAPPT
jgi:50S ribosomal subunit-associated GTPase HflX